MNNQQLADYYRAGCGNTCHVCEDTLYGGWTDYNGQIRCWICGTTYQVLGSHLTEEFLTQIGLKKEEVAKRYCDCITAVPLLKEYWQDKKIKIPFGSYFLSDGGITREERDSFVRYLKQNASKWRPLLPDDFDWDGIAGWQDPAAFGEGI